MNKLYIVGHTDDTGSLSHNLDLSRRRAEAVVAGLVNDYEISGDRLTAFGAGPYAPVASNESEEGRKNNRRVELVKRSD
jgi:outer membrane protein OmpA-like peptidoglycan-associated protein